MVLLFIYFHSNLKIINQKILQWKIVLKSIINEEVIVNLMHVDAGNLAAL